MFSPELQEAPLAPAAGGPQLTDPAAVLATLEALPGQPAWLSVRRRQAWDRYQELPFPHRKDEAWRFASIDRNLFSGYRLGAGVPADVAAEMVARSLLVGDPLARLVFADNTCLAADPLPESLTARGVIFLPLQEALARHSALLEPLLFAHFADLGGQKFTALHTALATAGAVLIVPPGVEIAQPIAVYHWLNSPGAAVFPHTLILAGDHARVNLVECYFSRHPDTPGLAVTAAHVHAGAGSQVFRKVVQDWNEATVSHQSELIRAGRDATVKHVAINLGGARARLENRVVLEGPGARINMYALSVAEARQEFDQRTLQVHAAPDTFSDLLYKNALMEESRTIFSGLIKVEPDAQRTDAYQTNRNLLLDPTAEANSLPGLEIGANDVKCSHGATTGRIDPGELFYLRSRGIPDRIAKQLLVFGFFEEIVDKVDHPELAEGIREIVRAKFAQHLRA